MPWPFLCHRKPATTQSAVRWCLIFSIARLPGWYVPSSGLAITPDAGAVPNVVAGQTNVDFTFTVTNSGNYATLVRFLASGASVQLSGPATVQKAVIDVNSNGIDAGDTDILTNGADVLSASVARNATLTVIVRVNINAAAAAGSTINIKLGDAATGGPTFDNQTANNSANEVRTSVPGGTTAPVRGSGACPAWMASVSKPYVIGEI